MLDCANASKDVMTKILPAISPIDCHKLKPIAYAFIAMLASSVFFNVTLLWIFIKMRPKSRRSAAHLAFGPMLMFVLTMLNLIGTLVEFPLVIVNSYSCRWMFGWTGCVSSSFAMYFIGSASTYLVVAISVERYLIMKSSSNRVYFTFGRNIAIICGCILLGLFWPLMPFIGWSHYSMDTTLITCSISWQDRSLNVISYNATIFVFVYFLPLSIIAFTNIKLIVLMKKMNATIIATTNNVFFKRKLERENKITMVGMVVIGGFMISWTPYALISLQKAFFDVDVITPFVSLLPTVFAKSTFLWLPVLYIFTDTRVRVLFLSLFKSGSSLPQSNSMFFGTTFDSKLTRRSLKSNFIDLANENRQDVS